LKQSKTLQWKDKTNLMLLENSTEFNMNPLP